MAELKQKVSFEEIAEFRAKFNKYALPDSEKINIENFDELIKECDEQIPQFKLRKVVCDRRAAGKSDKLEFEEFLDIFSKLSTKAVGASFKQTIEKRENLNTVSTSAASAQGTKHSFLDAEKEMFSSWINTCLRDDKSLKDHLPIDAKKPDSVFVALKDGIVLCKLINWAVANTIDERVMNTKKLTVYTIHENQTLVLNSALAIGCNIINIGAEDLIDGKPHLVLGLLWQIIRIGLFNRINIKHCPGISALLEGDESISDITKLSPEDIVLRWVNFHMRETGYMRNVKNFSEDIKDSEVYSVLMKKIAPPTVPLDEPHITESDLVKRAEKVLENAKKLDCDSFVRPSDIVEGNPKLNLAFMCHLFNSHPSLEFDESEVIDIEETREEKTLRNWINSLGVKPQVHHLFSDLADGIALAQLFEQIKPGVVKWKSITMPPFPKLSGKMKKLENCNYVVTVADELKLSVVGIGGQDIYEGSKKLILGLVSQAMHFYTLSLLQTIAGSDKPVKDEQIINWVNEKLQQRDKASKVANFKDPTIGSSQAIIDLIDSIKPKSVYYPAVQTTDTDEAKFSNAKFAISMARKVGARIYALPEDIVEVNPKMVMTIFACLMASGLKCES
ncbi:plastin-2-like isoform X2 [Dendronephthya gigantea]|nr:plastin-2-like isoform X2 [Dendronephthya gigantea]